MPDVTIPSGELNEFDLPPVCIITGEREGVVFKPVKFSWYPRWIGFLVLLNVFIALIVASAMTKRVKGTLPFTEAAWSRWKRGQVIMIAACVLALALFFGGLALLLGEDPTPLGFVSLALCVALPVAAWIYFLRDRAPRVVRIDKEAIVLSIPNAEAAFGIAHRSLSDRYAGDLPEVEVDETGAPARAVCFQHPDIVANCVCTRCGVFICPRCENRVRRHAPPLCPGCWERRSRAVPKPVGNEGPDLSAAGIGLWVGIISVIPMCIPAQVVSLVLNTVNLVRNRHPQSPQLNRRKAIAGLVLTGIGVLLTVALRNLHV